MWSAQIMQVLIIQFYSVLCYFISGLVGMYQNYQGDNASIFGAEDGGSMFLRNVGFYPQFRTTL
jgi:hypothetical protein